MQQAYIAENVRGRAGPGRDPADPFANAGIDFVEVSTLSMRLSCSSCGRNGTQHCMGYMSPSASVKGGQSE